MKLITTALPLAGIVLADSAQEFSVADHFGEILCSADAETICTNLRISDYWGCIDRLEILKTAEECSNTHSTRSFNFGSGNSWTRRVMKNINGYGCWCYFSSNYESGKGSPVTDNDVDNFCKILMNGYKCMVADDSSCDPMNQSYTSATGAALMSTLEARSAIWTACVAANQGDNCAARACSVEGYFIMNIFEHFLNEGSLDMTAVHSEGFDTSVCTRSSTGGASTSEICCGSYPERAMHQQRDDAADRTCCGMHYYRETGAKSKTQFTYCTVQ